MEDPTNKEAMDTVSSHLAMHVDHTDNQKCARCHAPWHLLKKDAASNMISGKVTRQWWKATMVGPKPSKALPGAEQLQLVKDAKARR